MKLDIKKSYPRIILIIVLLLLNRVLRSPWWSTWSTTAWSWWSPSARRLSHHQSQVVRVLFDSFWLVFSFSGFPNLVSHFESPLASWRPTAWYRALCQSIDRSHKDIENFVFEAQRQQIFLTQLQEECGAAGAPRADPRDGQVQRRLVVQLADLYLTLPWDINFMRNISR